MDKTNKFIVLYQKHEWNNGIFKVIHYGIIKVIHIKIEKNSNRRYNTKNEF